MRAGGILIGLVLSIALWAYIHCSAAEANDLAAKDVPPVASPAGQKIQTHSPLVTGNGFGYAVVDTTGDVTRLYAHPYRFERANADITKDGPSTANLLGRLGWYGDVGEGHTPELSYLQQSHIISAKKPKHEDLYFMPFGLRRNVLIAIRRHAFSQSLSPLNPIWEHPVERVTKANYGGFTVRVFTFQGVKESFLLAPLQGGDGLSAGKDALAGNAWAIMVLENADEAEQAVKDLLSWKNGLTNDELVQRELADFEAWRVKPNVQFQSDKERQLWRQSEAVLRMAQIREQNRPGRFNNGLILASLPNGVWFTPWVRDMSYAMIALVRMGHEAEARQGILAWLEARPVGLWRKDTGNLDYQISVTRYYGDGSEEADFSGQKTENCEFDDWGLALWAISEYWQKTHDQTLLTQHTYRGTVYESLRDFVVKPLLGNLDQYGGGLIVAEDSSCWEEHQENKRHYACSTVAAIQGLRGFLPIAKAMHDQATVKLVQEKLLLLEKGFAQAFIKDGFVRGTAEVDTQPKSEVDGAVLEALNLGIVQDRSVFDKTLAQMERLKTASGGYRRNLGPSNYEAHEFLLIDLNMARAYFKLGKKTEGASILSTIVDKSSQDRGLIAEMYVSAKDKGEKGEIGDPAGSIPMVGFGAGDFVITLSDREKYGRPSR